MGKLKPIGSEKLQGSDMINRILEISNYKLNIPKPINEDTSVEYKKTLVDGNTYHIVKEKNGYVIKKGLTESVSEYIEPIKNRKFYPSYSQALKRLNLITKEVNYNQGYDRGISLFESDDEKEYVLKVGGEQTEQAAPQQAPPPAPAPAAPAPVPTTAPAPPPVGDEMPEPEVQERFHHGSMRDRQHSKRMDNMFEDMFTESKVDKVLSKYFQPKTKVVKTKSNDLLKYVEALSENFNQEKSASRLLREYPEAKLIGKNKNNSLVFLVNEEKISVTPKGSIL